MVYANCNSNVPKYSYILHITNFYAIPTTATLHLEI